MSFAILSVDHIPQDDNLKDFKDNLSRCITTGFLCCPPSVYRCVIESDSNYMSNVSYFFINKV